MIHTPLIADNIHRLWTEELNWFKYIFQNRLRMEFKINDEIDEDWIQIPPEYPEDTLFLKLLPVEDIEVEERLLLLLALLPHIAPDFLDQAIKEVVNVDGDLPQLGGVKGQNYRAFLPTGETAVYLLAGSNFEERFRIQQFFSPDHWFSKYQILSLESVREGEPLLSGRLILDPEYIELFTLGKISRPVLSTSFPAQHIETALDWEDLVLPDSTAKKINELLRWVKHNDTLFKDWKMEGKLKAGYRALFYGPPGTGKTLTASLLGKTTGRDVFRIDLSMVVSKYIGETEKNLSRLFDKAKNKNWILFFDEADALFGKRTDIRDAHDKYANQEVSYLLQRIENFDGLTILASNLKDNMDDAFTRRFQSIIFFPFPKPVERLKLWQKAFPPQVDTSLIDFQSISTRYELNGANIMNIVQFTCLSMIAQNTQELTTKVLLEAISKEYEKEGKLM